VTPSATFDPAEAAAVLLASVRVLAWLSVVPPFSGPYVPKAARAGAALAVGLVVGPKLHMAAVPSWQQLIADAVGQVLIGAAFGALTMILLQAVTSAGDSLDLFGGLVLPQALEPIGSQASTSVGQLYTMVTFALLVVTGGDLLLLRGLITTFGVVGPTLTALAPMAHGAVQAVATMFTAAFEIVGPLLAVEFLVQVALGMLAKSAPTVNVFLFAFSVQTLVLVLALALGASILPSAVHRLVDDALSLEGSLL
jgi:flagellar biosynthetic protein FliR